MLIMPFGKHKGERLNKVPAQYLEWLTENIRLREPLKSAVRNELARHTGGMTTTTPAQNKVKAVYRNLALKWHPGRGGTHEAMAAINEFYESLTQWGRQRQRYKRQ